MRILIAGAGEAGMHLAKTLSTENFDVVVIDPDSEKLDRLNGYNLLAIAAEPLSIDSLRNAGVARADMFVALTPSESDNLMLSIMAKRLGARITVARISRDCTCTPACTQLLSEQGVDYLVYPEMLAVHEVENALRHPWSRHWSEMCGGNLVIAAATINPGSTLSNLLLKDFAHSASYFHVSAVARGRQTIIPDGNTLLADGDIAYISTTAERINEIGALFGHQDSPIRKVMVVGGSRVGEMVARHLGKHYDLMLVEKDLRRAQLLAETIPSHVVVANGDGRSIEFLESEWGGGFDAYLAFTESSEGNIIGCQIAREMGVMKTVVKTTSIDLVAEAEKLGINTVVNKSLLCSGRIRQILLDACENQSMSIAGADVTVVSVPDGARVTHHKIRDLKLPKGVTIAGIVRDGVGMVAMGDTQLQAGDRVALFMLQGTLLPIRKLFM